MELNNFITGERLQGLADISLIPEGTDNGESECEFVKTQQRNNNYKVFYYNNSTSSLPETVHSSKIIFVNTWTLNKFFKIIFPLLKNNHIFISHNSDMGFNINFAKFLEDNRIIKWYTQNKEFNHLKINGLPIGIANQQYPHGNLNLLNNTINKNHKKDILVFKNFDVNTNRNERVNIDNITRKNGIGMIKCNSQEEYFDFISKSMFVINPPGNGPDCHRIWESLYLNAVPIVKYSECFSDFKDLPIMFINDWEDVTITGLRQNIQNYKIEKFNNEKLNFDYWKKLICSI
jgi:hypothetical protein